MGNFHADKKSPEQFCDTEYSKMSCWAKHELMPCVLFECPNYGLDVAVIVEDGKRLPPVTLQSSDRILDIHRFIIETCGREIGYSPQPGKDC